MLSEAFSSRSAPLSNWEALPRQSTTYVFGPFELNPAQRVLLCQRHPVGLTARCFDLLCLLICNRHRMLSRKELFDSLWDGVCVEDANLTVNVSLLRKALGENRDQRRYIATLPRRGYRFVAEVTVQAPHT
jgi:DNA-binding winged helix-turn-helix (wHTH) protein